MKDGKSQTIKFSKTLWDTLLMQRRVLYASLVMYPLVGSARSSTTIKRHHWVVDVVVRNNTCPPRIALLHPSSSISVCVCVCVGNLAIFRNRQPTTSLSLSCYSRVKVGRRAGWVQVACQNRRLHIDHKVMGWAPTDRPTDQRDDRERENAAGETLHSMSRI